MRARTFNPFTTHCVRIRACGQLAFKGFVYPGGGAAIRGAAQPRREVERGQLQFERISSPRKRKRSPESPPGPGPSGLNRLSGVYKQAELEGFSYIFFVRMRARCIVFHVWLCSPAGSVDKRQGSRPAKQ